MVFYTASSVTKSLRSVRDPGVATSLLGRACVYERQGKYEEALAMYIQSLEITREATELACCQSAAASIRFERRRHDEHRMPVRTEQVRLQFDAFLVQEPF